MQASQRDLVSLHARAVDNLQYIRQAIESSGSFTSVPGMGILLIGLSAGLVFLLGRPLDSSAQTWLFLWGGEAVLAILLGLLSTLRKARRDGRDLRHPVSRRFLLNLAPPLTAGAILTFAILARGADLKLLPGLWLLLYGTGVLTAGAFSIRIVPVMGVCFMAIGLVTLCLDASWNNAMMGLGFGGLHVIFGGIIAKYHGG